MYKNRVFSKKGSHLVRHKKRILVTGHKGMVGSAVCRALYTEGHELITASRAEVDLLDIGQVRRLFSDQKPDLVFHAAAKVGGISSNANLPADFIFENLMTQSHVINSCHEFDVEKLIFVSTNCTYPQHSTNPISETAILSGDLEPNVRAYAVAKIAGMEMCNSYFRQYGRNFISVIPPNLYGLGDNFNPLNSHIIAGIMRKAHIAKTMNMPFVEVWGDGTARRETLNVEDLANAMIHLMYSETRHQIYNVGSGRDNSVAEIAKMICDVVGFSGEIVFDKSKPAGTKKKLLNSSRLEDLGWIPKIHLKEGLKVAYRGFLESKSFLN